MTNREKDILKVISENPSISQQEIAELLGIKRASVAVQISNLMKKGKILGKGYILGTEPYVAVIGGSNMDIAGFPQKAIRLRDSNPGAIKLSVGGVGRNIADNLSRLGIFTKLLTAVGSDLYGKKLIETGLEVGIDMQHALTVEGQSTAIYLSILDEHRDMMLAIVDGEINAFVNRSYLNQKKNILNQATALVIDTNLSPEALETLASQHGDKKIFADTVSASKAVKLKPILNALYAIKPNRLEAEILTGVSIMDRESLDEAMTVFLRSGVKKVFISLGDEGVYFGDAKQRGFFKPKALEVVNATGAGDAFMAGIVYGDLQGASIEDCVKYASAMAELALVSEKTISDAVSEHKIKEMIKESQTC